MNALRALIAILGVALAAAVVARSNFPAILVLIPCAAFALFLVGFSYRILRWAWVPVPFRITATCGQQKSLVWIKPAPLDNPSTGWGAFGRVTLEVLLFRSLFRNRRARLGSGKLSFREDQWLWAGALAFHWSLLTILIRHLRFFLQPVPSLVRGVERLDGILQVGLPHIYISDVVFAAALAYLLIRRLQDPVLRFVSLFSDYFVLFLLSGIALTGLLMRFFVRADLVAIKQFGLSLAAMRPHAPISASPIFVIHLLMVSVLAGYFPASKLMHMAGVFLSPTRNLPNNNRAKRHVNPWNAPVAAHSYAEWEQEFRDKLKIADLPLEVEDAERTTAD